jgi:60 kDa SS-A/Ro ribonucleoprotein
MSKFNSTKEKGTTKTVNLAGGEAYTQGPELELVSLLLTSFVQDQFYRSADDQMKRIGELLNKVDPKFAAKAAIYTRNVFGMRSITHVLAVEIAKHLSGKEWGKKFFTEVIRRPDDMTEILAYYLSKNKGKSLPNALKKGFAKAFDKFDNFQLAKYKGEGKEVSLVDAVNMVHPKATDKNAQALEQLIKGELKVTETWEAKLSDAGKKADNDEELSSLKKDAWAGLIREKKLGYLALLRNLRNIMEQAPEVLDEALASLTNEGFIKKSLTFPFQYLVAYKQFSALNTKEARKVADALSRAIDISCDNIKSLDFGGNTLVVVDNSGSMDSPVAKSEHMKKSELGGLFGIVLAKAINADIMEFGDSARYINYSLSTSSMDFAANFTRNNKVGHGTDFHSIFQTANKKYDRIIIFSDCQGWIGGYTPTSTFNSYKNKFGCNPHIYSFDLAGYGTMQFPENQVYAIAGFSDKVFTIMANLEKDKKALVNTIKNYIDL